MRTVQMDCFVTRVPRNDGGAMSPPQLLPDALVLLDYVGIAVFAVSGALLAAEKKQTLVTFIFFAVITGVGGGTMRDLLIGAPVFWVHTNATLLICIGAALGVWFLSRQVIAERALLWFDAVGLAAYATYGAAKALSYGVAPVPAFAMGVMTACVGGIIRDVLANEPSILMRPELYVTAAALASGPVRGAGPVRRAAALAALVAGLAGFSLARRGDRPRAVAPAYNRYQSKALAALQHRRPCWRHDRRILPHPAPAALCLRRSQCDEGGGTGARRGHCRPRHGQSRRRAAQACHRQAGRSRGQADRAPLFGVEGHSRPAQGPGRLLPAPLRRRARSRPRGDRHAGQQGRPRQPRPGDHRAGRRRADPQPELSDPPLRLHHRRRRDPLDPGRARTRFLRPARTGDALHRAAAQGAGDRLSVATRPPRWSTSPSTRSWSPSPARPRGCRHFRPRLCRNLFRRHADPVDPPGGGRQGHRGRVHLDVQDLFDGRLADRASRSATRS